MYCATPQQHKQGQEQGRERAPGRMLSRRATLTLLAAVPLAIAWELADKGRSSDTSDTATASSRADNEVAIMELPNEVQSKWVVMGSKVPQTEDQWRNGLTA